MHTTQSNKLKKALNIILAIVLVLGIFSSCFGTYFVVFANNSQSTVNPDAPSTPGDPQQADAYETPDFGSAANEAVLNDDVKIFSGAEATKINNALVSVDDSYNAYNAGGTLEFTFSGEQEELFGDLNYGDFFMLDGVASSHFGNTYIMKVQSLYQSGDETVLTVVQPELGEVFESIDVGFNDILTEENLVSSTTADGISMHFGDISKEITEVQSVEPFDSSSPSVSVSNLAFSGNTETVPLASDYSTEPTDLIIDIEIGYDDDEDDKGSFDTNADWECKLKGQIGVEDLSAYMVCDMPEPAKFNELMFGVRGKKVIDSLSFDLKFDASFEPKKTKFEYDGLFIDAEISGLNKKWFPMGIWQFTGSTLIKISKDGFEKANIAPSIFVMLYMDTEGHFSLDFNAGYSYESTFNNGLSVYKDGELSMGVTSYPYISADGEIIENSEEETVWHAELSLEANTSLTLMGSSVLFYLAGINIGEIQLINFGTEIDGNISIKVDSKDGVVSSNDTGETSLYWRLFLKALGLKAKVSAEVEAFQHKISGEFDFAYQVIDITLWKIGKEPDKYQHRVPVSSKWTPSEFESVVCLVSDVSGSMDWAMDSGESKMEALQEAGHVITKIVENASKQYEGNQGLSIVSFSSEAQTIAMPHNDYEFINACIDTLSAYGDTNISAGLNTGINQLINVNSKQKTILLMTDGQDNCSTTDEILEQAKRAKDNDIKIFTIGFGSDVDEDILTKIATETGGEYRYSATDGFISIIGGFIYSYESSRGDVLVDVQATVEEGQTVAVDKFNVPDKAGDLNATLYWPGSVLDLILIDPNGRKVDADYPGAIINDSEIPVTVTVKEPLSGKWTFKVKGVETSYDEEPFYALASFKKASNASADFNPKLSDLTTIGAFCLPIGVFMIFVSGSLLILSNKKKKPSAE